MEEEIVKIFEWLANDFEKLSFNEKIFIASAVSEMVDKIKPIYMKHEAFNDGSTFFFKM